MDPQQVYSEKHDEQVPTFELLDKPPHTPQKRVSDIADNLFRSFDLGVTLTDAAISDEHTWVMARLSHPDTTCPHCGKPGKLRDHIYRTLNDIPIVGYATKLHLGIPRFSCTNDQCAAKVYRAKLDCVHPNTNVTTRAARWIVQRIAIDKMSVRAVARLLQNLLEHRQYHCTGSMQENHH